MVSEIVKHRTNQGERGGVFFYRDQHGTEADLVVESGRRRVLVEAKAGQTASEDMLAAARRIKAALIEAGPCQTVVAYGGQGRQSRQDALLLPWDEIDQESWTN